MKKSHAVPLSLVTTLAAAALASGCGSFARREGWQTCVDTHTNVAVDQQYCDDGGNQRPSSGIAPHYYWYYYPRGYYWNAPYVGQPVPLGGSYSVTPHNSAPMAHSGGRVARGGFGSTASGHGSGGA